MSAIGSFYVLPARRHESLANAAEISTAALAPTKKRWGRAPAAQPIRSDPIADFLGRNAAELEDLPYSGYLLLDVELLAPGALESDDDLGGRLSQSTGSTFVSFRPTDADRSIQILDSADFSDEAIRQFLIEENRVEDAAEIVDSIRGSREVLRRWLQSVTEGVTGILYIG
jgi:hypothetical protein